MTKRWFVVETVIAGRRDARFVANDEAPWRHLPRPYAGMAGAADRIADAGYGVLFPLDRKLEIDRLSGKPVVVDRPFYAGYLLASFDVASDNWGEIARMRGVYSVLSLDGERPIPVRESVIDKLIAADIARSTLTLETMLKGQRRKREPFVAGDAVRLKTGPLAGIDAKVKHDAGGEDIRLTVAGWLEVTAPAGDVAVAA